MAKKVEATPVRETGDKTGGIAVSAARQDHPGVLSTSEAVVSLAEELGRLLARRLLADPGRRRGYSLAEVILGAAVMALMLVVIARASGLISR